MGEGGGLVDVPCDHGGTIGSGASEEQISEKVKDKAQTQTQTQDKTPSEVELGDSNPKHLDLGSGEDGKFTLSVAGASLDAAEGSAAEALVGIFLDKGQVVASLRSVRVSGFAGSRRHHTTCVDLARALTALPLVEHIELWNWGIGDGPMKEIVRCALECEALKTLNVGGNSVSARTKSELEVMIAKSGHPHLRIQLF